MEEPPGPADRSIEQHLREGAQVLLTGTGVRTLFRATVRDRSEGGVSLTFPGRELFDACRRQPGIVLVAVLPAPGGTVHYRLEPVVLAEQRGPGGFVLAARIISTAEDRRPFGEPEPPRAFAACA